MFQINDPDCGFNYRDLLYVAAAMLLAGFGFGVGAGCAFFMLLLIF